MQKASFKGKKLVSLVIMETLDYVYANEHEQLLSGFTPYTLAGHLWCSPQYCNKILKSLISDGFVMRFESTTDKGQNSYSYLVTEAGIEYLRTMLFVAQQEIDLITQQKREKVGLFTCPKDISTT